MNFELTGVAVVAFSGAVGVLMGWALCNLGHTRVRADARHFKTESDTLRAKAIRFDEHRISLKKDREILVAEANLLRSKLGLAPMNEVGDLKAAVEKRELELQAEAELADAERVDQAQEGDGTVVDLTTRDDRRADATEAQSG